jgi:hypothetical protein
MPYHQSSAVSVATIITTATVMVLGYRAGRTHAAWKDVRDAKRAVAVNRRHAWRHTLTLTVGTAVVLVTLLAAGYDMSR